MLEKIKFYLTAILLAALPFHAILTVTLKYGLALDKFKVLGFLISSWKEIMIIILGLVFVLELLVQIFNREKKKLEFLNQMKTNYSFQLIAIFLIFGTFSFFLNPPPNGISQFIWGFRYDYFFLISFVLFSFSNLNKNCIQKLIDIASLSAISAISLGLVIYLLNPENLTFLGYRNDWSTWYANQSLAFCQKIENSNMCRLSGTFAGPNQYGAYLIVIIPLLLWQYLQKKSKLWLSAIALAIISLVLTFSRSAWIGFAAEAALVFFFHFKRNKSEQKIFRKEIKILFAALISLVLVISSSILISESLRQKLIRPESSSGHLIAFNLGVETIQKSPFGLGLGTAGPASYRFESPIITENWYLQIGVELGLLGMLIFITIICSLILDSLRNQKILKINNQELLLTISLIGISIAALFLHSFEDSSTVLSLFILLALSKQLKHSS